MCKRLFYLAPFVLVLALTAGAAFAGIDYLEPEGGWAYIYTGEAAASDVTAALDGTWDHYDASGGHSDAWDGSAPGDSGSAGAGNAPGGAGIFTDAGTTFLRIQDCGDPRDSGGGWGEPSNRKLTFGRDLGLDGVDGSTILDDGVTISFRARIPTTDSAGDLDPHYPNGGGGPLTWTTRGYNIHDDGLGAFGIKQGTGSNGVVSFSLCTADDEGVSGAGLVMNKLNGSSPTSDVHYHQDAGTENLLTGFDPTEWHEFWIQIVGDTSGGGTHKVSIYVDGSITATEFHVTAGDKDEYDFNGYLCMSLGRTDIEGAQDVDFFAYKPGIIAPNPSNPNLARALNPPPGTTVNLPDATPLSWTAGESAARHDVYLGTNEADVNDADATDTTGIYRGRKNVVLYTPTEALELGQTYYWRIDEVEADNTTIHKGDVWSFTIIGYILIDDFEGYLGDEVSVLDQIWGVWRDGLGFGDPAVPPYSPGNGTGSEIGDVGTTSYTEATITHDGSGQSMPYWYNNNKPDKAKYSEAKRALTVSRDWTEQGVKALSIWFRGHPEAMGGFTEAPAGTYTMTAAGANIENESDQFHFAWQQLNGPGTITAKVVSVENTHEYAKAGVMIRDTLDADSAHAMVAITPGNGVWFGRRTSTGNDTDTEEQSGITAPYWVRLERTSGGGVRASYSADGSAWTPLGTLTSVTMSLPMYVGLALTSHEPGVQCEAVFSNVTSDGTGPWTAQDIGLTNNQAVPMYVAVANNTGAPGVVYHEDPNATLVNDYTEWHIDLKDIADKGVDLTDVNSIAIGFGDRDNPVAGGAGKMYFDDIRLYRPRYVPDKVTPLEGDSTDDGIVNYRDVEIMANDWLMGDFTRPGPLLVHYKFDEGAGTVAADSSGLGNDGAFSGTATWASNEIGGWAGAFDGGVGEVRNDSVSANLNGLSALSFGAWIKSNVTGTDAGFIIFADPDGTDQRDIRYDAAGSSAGGANVIKYGVSTMDGGQEDSHENESAANVQTTQWQHVMVTWTSGEAAKLYINGVLDIPTNEDDIISGTTSGYRTVIVGRGGKDENGGWDGLVDDVRVYEVALTAAEVQTVMNGGDVPVVDVYVPLTSVANISDEEPANSKKVNFKDFAVLADEWLGELLWPRW